MPETRDENLEKPTVITEEQQKSTEQKPLEKKKLTQPVKQIREKLNEKKFFWYDLIGRSQDYSQVMELDCVDIEDLFVSQSDKTREGFYSIIVDDKKVNFIIASDMAVNYGIVSEDQNAHWRCHFIIMAHFPDHPELNKGNGVKEPWLKRKRHNDDDDEEEEEQWTTIVASEKLHLDIIEAFKALKKEDPT
jgi:hypothetical protein